MVVNVDLVSCMVSVYWDALNRFIRLVGVGVSDSAVDSPIILSAGQYHPRIQDGPKTYQFT